MTDNYDNTPESGKMYSRKAITNFQADGSDGGQYDLILLAAHRAKKMKKKGVEYKLDESVYAGTKPHVAVVKEVVEGVTTYDELSQEYLADLSAETVEEKEQELIR